MSNSNAENNFLSRDTFTSLKGYLALLVLIHHVTQFTNFMAGTSIGYALLLLGHYAVVIFIFMSGYGLFASYEAKGDAYIRQFPKKRLLPFYLTYLFFLIVYIIYELIIGTKISVSDIIFSLTYGKTLLSFGWYLQLTTLLYVAFFLIWRFVKNDTAKILFMWSFVIVLITLSIEFQAPRNNYMPAFSFVIGIMYARHKETIKKFAEKHSVISLLISAFVFAAGALAYTLIDFRLSDVVNKNAYLFAGVIIIMIITDMALIFLAMSFCCICSKIIPAVIINPVSSFLGQYSLEIYAVQGLVLRIFYQIIKNQVLYAILSAAAVIFLAVVTHCAISLIKKSISKTSASS